MTHFHYTEPDQEDEFSAFWLNDTNIKDVKQINKILKYVQIHSEINPSALQAQTEAGTEL